MTLDGVLRTSHSLPELPVFPVVSLSMWGSPSSTIDIDHRPSDKRWLAHSYLYFTHCMQHGAITISPLCPCSPVRPGFALLVGLRRLDFGPAPYRLWAFCMPRFRLPPTSLPSSISNMASL